MRTFKPLAGVAILLCISFFSQGQILNRVKQKAEQRANQKIDQAIDKGLDKTEDAAKTDKNKKDSTKTTTSKKDSNSQTTNPDADGATKNPVDFKTYSKFDFVAGDKIVAIEDF